MTLTLRHMRRSDLAMVAAMEEDLFGEEAWSPGMLASELGDLPDRFYLVADEDGQIAGYAGLLAPMGEHADVLTIAVARPRWGLGIGTALLEALVAETARRGCPEIYLEVRVDNDRAQRLYRRYGFNAVGLRRGYYQPSGTDAVVMRRVTGAPAARASGSTGRDTSWPRGPGSTAGGGR